MWTAGLSITGTLLGFYATGVSAQAGVKCLPEVRGEAVNNELEANVKQIAVELCELHLEEGSHDPFIRKPGPGGYALTITHSVEDPDDVEVEDCTAFFNEIIEQCILHAGVWGGTAYVDGLMYEIFQDDITPLSAGPLEARAATKPPAIPKKKSDKTGAGIVKQKGEKEKKPVTAPIPIVKPRPIAKPKPTPTPKSSNDDACDLVPDAKDAKGKDGKSSQGGKVSKGSKDSKDSKGTKKISARGCNDPPPKNLGPGYYDSLDQAYRDGPEDDHICATEKIKMLRRSVNRVVFGAPLHKRSGTKYAKTWTEWQKILNVLDEELGKIAPAGKKFQIIWAGGMTAVHLGFRGATGKTGDIDFLYYFGTPDADKALFLQAIKNTYTDRRNDLPGKSPELTETMQITNSMEENSQGTISDARLKQWTAFSKAENKAAFKGKHFEAHDGDVLFQIFGKMDRMYKDRKAVKEQQINDGYKYGNHSPKDRTDAQKLFKLWFEKHKRKLTLEDVAVPLKQFFDKDAKYVKEVIGYTMWIVAEYSKEHLADDLLAVMKEEDDECDDWKLKNPRKKKATKPPPTPEEIEAARKAKAEKAAQKPGAPSGGG